MVGQKQLFLEIEQHLLKDKKPSNYLEKLYDNPIFKQHPFEMLYVLKETEQSPKYHPEGNVWNHTMLVVDKAAQVRENSKNQRVFMWAALLHDIGKPLTTRKRKGRITSYDHDKAGAKLTEKFLLVFTEEEKFISGVCGLVNYHMQILYVVKGLSFADIDNMKRNVDIGEVALLGLCDRLGRGKENLEEEKENITEFLHKCGLKTDILNHV